MISEREFARYMQVLEKVAGRPWLQVFYHYSRYLDGDGNATNCMTYILNAQRMETRMPSSKRRLMQNDMWFECPAKEIEKDLGVKSKRRRNALKELKRRGLIDIKHRWGNHQWIRINPDKVLEMESFDQDSEIPLPARKQKSGNPTPDESAEKCLVDTSEVSTRHFSEKCLVDTSHLRRKKDKHCRSQARDGVPSTLGFGIVKERKSKAKDLTKRLHALLLKHNKVMRKVNPSQWEKRFAELIGLVDDVKQIDEVMTWYSRHIGKRYVPRVYSAEAFLEKYNQLVDAMERWQESDPSDDDFDSEIKAKRTVLPNGRIRVEY